jgi:hypothetical protein
MTKLWPLGLLEERQSPYLGVGHLEHQAEEYCMDAKEKNPEGTHSSGVSCQELG